MSWSQLENLENPRSKQIRRRRGVKKTANSFSPLNYSGKGRPAALSTPLAPYRLQHGENATRGLIQTFRTDRHDNTPVSRFRCTRATTRRRRRPGDGDAGDSGENSGPPQDERLKDWVASTLISLLERDLALISGIQDFAAETWANSTRHTSEKNPKKFWNLSTTIDTSYMKQNDSG